MPPQVGNNGGVFAHQNNWFPWNLVQNGVQSQNDHLHLQNVDVKVPLLPRPNTGCHEIEKVSAPTRTRSVGAQQRKGRKHLKRNSRWPPPFLQPPANTLYTPLSDQKLRHWIFCSQRPETSAAAEEGASENDPWGMNCTRDAMWSSNLPHLGRWRQEKEIVREIPEPDNPRVCWEDPLSKNVY